MVAAAPPRPAAKGPRPAAARGGPLGGLLQGLGPAAGAVSPTTVAGFLVAVTLLLYMAKERRELQEQQRALQASVAQASNSPGRGNFDRERLQALLGPAGEDACRDLKEECAAWASVGQCESNAAFMLGEGDFEGQCRLSCRACTPRAAPEPLQPECEDLSPNCKEWASSGECQNNPTYMLGAGKIKGQCRDACGACEGVVLDGDLQKEYDASRPIINTEMPFKWPQKELPGMSVCVGMTQGACTSGLYKNRDPENLFAEDRTIVAGVGGPTGCTEAIATLMTSDEQLAGVLVWLFSLRYHTTTDKDVVVFVTEGVGDKAIETLKKSCVLLRRIKSQLEGGVPVGFAKLNLWLAIEYKKLLFVSIASVFRKDPAALFAHAAPTCVKGKDHVRMIHQTFSADAFMLEPSRAVFYNMVAKTATIDSLDMVGDQRRHTDDMFFSQFFTDFRTFGDGEILRVEDVARSLVPEIGNKRLRSVIKAVPPRSRYTLLNYRNLQVGAVAFDAALPPWNPGWRVTCAYPCAKRRYKHLYEALAEEWWQYYYALIGKEDPADREFYSLAQEHDPLGYFEMKDHALCVKDFCMGDEVADLDKNPLTERIDKDLVGRFPSKPAEDPLPLDAFTPAPAKGKKAKKAKRPKARRLGAR